MKHSKLFNALLLGGIVVAVSGCDSSYRSYDGNTGFKFTPVSIDHYILEYHGAPKNSKQDVETMWHHAAREICRGAGYQHRISQIEQHKGSASMGNELIPKEESRYKLQGEVTCIAPNIAQKRRTNLLLGDYLTTNDFVSGRTPY